METTKLQNSIENLYKIFAKYPLKPSIEGCPCCVGKKDNSILYTKSLRELSGEDLSFYGFKAMTTFGDVEDFKHFLPRLFETMVQEELNFNDETLFNKLDYGNWQNWNETEITAIENFFFELFRTSVNFSKKKADLIETYLVGIANAVKDITPYLNLWLEDISKSKIFTLRYFIIDSDYAMSNAFLADYPKKRLQIQNWLISEKVVSILENLYFNDTDFQKSDDLSKILETIYQLKNKLT